MRIFITALVVAAAVVVAGPSCVIGGDEPWDDNPGDTDTDIDGDGDGDGDTDTNTALYDGDGGIDGSVDAG
ncbi:MAG: hypothetical protein M0R80_14365 [Proteobacteria bacterium]|jgi:hypothetical protein|nr:hypothetical protein [Pseudomonadota bacterium]